MASNTPSVLHVSLRSLGGVGPCIYFERGNVHLHAWVKRFHLPYHHGFKWRFKLVVTHGVRRSIVNVGNG